MIDLIKGMIDDSGNGAGETLRFTVTIPKEYAILGAWMQFREEMLAAGRPALPRPVRLHLDGGQRGRDWNRARDYFAGAIWEAFDRDYTTLLLDAPGLPDPPGAASPEPRPAMCSRRRLEEAIDDDIPF